jgi:hypothetical protein
MVGYISSTELTSTWRSSRRTARNHQASIRWLRSADADFFLCRLGPFARGDVGANAYDPAVARAPFGRCAATVAAASPSARRRCYHSSVRRAQATFGAELVQVAFDVGTYDRFEGGSRNKDRRRRGKCSGRYCWSARSGRRGRTEQSLRNRLDGISQLLLRDECPRPPCDR